MAESIKPPIKLGIKRPVTRPLLPDPEPRNADAYAAAYARFLVHLDAARSAHAASPPSQQGPRQ